MKMNMNTNTNSDTNFMINMNSDSERSVHQICEDLLAYQNELHEQNQHRIRIGLRCIFTIPSAFLALMMISGAIGTSKIIFLVLWIASLFGIATYLILVEYADYKLQTRLNAIKGEESTPVEELIGGVRL